MEERTSNNLAQKAARLEGLMDEAAPPTIYSTKLTPQLAEAALNLSIDFHRQKQAHATSRMIRHPYTIGLVVSVFAIHTWWTLGDVLSRSGLWALKWHIEAVTGVVILTSMSSMIVFHLINRTTEVIRDKADRIFNESAPVFGFDIREFATVGNILPNKLTKEDKQMLSAAENTSVVVYRDTPIAVVSLVPVPSLCSDEKFVTKITSLGVRKVYRRSGIIEDLLDWAQYRSGILNNSKSSKILVCIEVVSTDLELKKVLKSKSFQFLEQRSINGSKVLDFYGVKNEIWGVPLSVKKLDEKAEKVASKVGATGSKRRS